MPLKIRTPAAVLCLFLNYSFASAAPQQLASTEIYIARARALDLARDEYWLKLLHAEKGWFGQITTRADHRAFFLTERNVKDPEAELEANIRALLVPAYQQGNTGYLCRFPARARYLAQRLSIPEELVRFEHCPGYNKFLNEYAIEQLSIVYAAANLSEPASMFGHAFFKIKSTSGKEYLLAFGARVTDSFFISYIYKGLTGGFYGTFQLADYSLALKEYSFGENRNLWEFSLKLDAQTRQRFIDHLWEMNSVVFRYYFMDENCSYYIPYFLEIADPSLKFSFRQKWFVLPASIMRELVQYWDKVDQIYFYPSVLNNYFWASRNLSRAELKAAFALADGNLTPEFFHSKRREAIAGAAHSIILLQNKMGKTELTEKGKSLLQRLEQNLAAHGLAAVNVAEPDVSNPVLGHGFGLFAAGGGGDTNGSFVFAQLRPLIHGLSDSPLGFLYGSELQVLNTELRYYPEFSTLYLDRLDLVAVQSLKPVVRPLFSLSWLANLGARDIARERGIRRANLVAANAEYRIGPTFAIPLPGEYAVLYTMAAVRGIVHESLPGRFALPPGFAAGLVYNPIDTVTVAIDYSWLHDFATPQNTLSKLQAATNFYFLPQLALQADATWFFLPTANVEARAALRLYF
ncbi:MAG: DUF4105 domain-containing protein [Turneriella sp.]|nr:DUF4105 domain-containing protein [Turneriella sp.]